MDFLLFSCLSCSRAARRPCACQLCDGRVRLPRRDRRAILAFRFLLPIDPARRLRSILVAIVNDLNTMAAADSLPLLEKCRAGRTTGSCGCSSTPES